MYEYRAGFFVYLVYNRVLVKETGKCKDTSDIMTEAKTTVHSHSSTHRKTT